MKAGPDGNQGFLLRRAVRIRQSAWDVAPRRLTRRPVSLTILALAVIELSLANLFGDLEFERAHFSGEPGCGLQLLKREFRMRVDL